ncbi:MAG TPA: hypothetical protein VFM18_02105 [Methanosarcina sp.]|nr:hypothetical protein [Methanosarcina sp.]
MPKPGYEGNIMGTVDERVHPAANERDIELIERKGMDNKSPIKNSVTYTEWNDD